MFALREHPSAVAQLKLADRRVRQHQVTRFPGREMEVLTEEGIGQQARHRLTYTPPDGQQRHLPLVFHGQKLEERRGVEDKVASDAETKKAHEDAPHGEARRGAANEAKGGADEETEVESPSSADDVCPQPPEEGAHKQAHVERDLGPGDVCRGVFHGDTVFADTHEIHDQGIDSVPAIELSVEICLHKMRGEPDPPPFRKKSFQ